MEEREEKGGKVSVMSAMEAGEKIYIGTKVIRGLPQEKGGQEGYRVVYEDGYVSWSPKATFERAYREMTGAEIRMVEDFSIASFGAGLTGMMMAGPEELSRATEALNKNDKPMAEEAPPPPLGVHVSETLGFTEKK